VIARLRRSLRRAVNSSGRFTTLSEAQIELVLLVELAPGTRVSEAAVSLGLAPNTVSTLVSRLMEAGMIERAPDPSDRRGGLLMLTAAGEQGLRAWRRQRALILETALSRLDAADGSAIETATPALWRLSRVLEDLDEAEPSGRRP
jgi:DNA-binding MarR family transcriptional regulator